MMNFDPSEWKYFLYKEMYRFEALLTDQRKQKSEGEIHIKQWEE